MRVADISSALLLAATFTFSAMANGIASGLPVMSDQRASLSGNTADHVRIKAVDRTGGGANRVIVVVVIDPGYHINANPASLDYLIPTKLKVTNLTPLRVIYPAPILFKPKFADETLKVYEGTIRIIAEFPVGMLTRQSPLFGTLTAQACTEDICLPPADLPLPNK
ncbi:MAG TPA: protein-disulfide reductase DsbD domain-containing protein [Stellaceae bacterium]|nr:protein-disulfide reductase DsbD domain-containing protein [Stellaceae bacterium]